MENIAVGVIMRVGIHETDIGIAMDSASGVEILPCGLGLDFIHLADGACHRAVEFVIEIYLLVGLCLRRKKGYVVIQTMMNLSWVYVPYLEKLPATFWQ